MESPFLLFLIGDIVFLVTLIFQSAFVVFLHRNAQSLPQFLLASLCLACV